MLLHSMQLRGDDARAQTQCCDKVLNLRTESRRSIKCDKNAMAEKKFIKF